MTPPEEIQFFQRKREFLLRELKRLMQYDRYTSYDMSDAIEQTKKHFEVITAHIEEMLETLEGEHEQLV